MSTLKVVKGTTIQMSLTALQQYNSETQAYANLTGPDTIKFNVTSPAGTVSTHTGDQIGSTNGWYAKKTLDSTGDWEWVARVIEGSDVLVTEPERIVCITT